MRQAADAVRSRLDWKYGLSLELADPGFNHTVYIALTALVINLAVAVVLTLVFRLANLPAGTDETAPAHYTADPDGIPRAAVPAATMPTETA